MERCFRLYNVQSQSQYSNSQRREEMRNEDANEDVAADNNVAEGQNVEAEMKNVQADAEPEEISAARDFVARADWRLFVAAL